MRLSLLAVALLAVQPAACTHAEQRDVPEIGRTLAAAVLLPLGPLGDREVFVDEPSFLRVEQVIPGEEFRASAIRAVLDRPVRTDLSSVAAVCPESAMCYLPGNPFVMAVDSVSRDGDHIKIRMHYMYNLNYPRSPVTWHVAHEITLLRVEVGWRIVSLVRHEA